MDDKRKTKSELLSELAELRHHANHMQGVIARYRQKEQEGFRYNALFRAIFENGNIGLVLADVNGVVIYRTPFYERLNGYTDEERLGHNFLELIHQDHIAELQQIWSQALQNPERTFTAEYRSQHKNGTWQWVETYGRNLLNNPIINAIILVTRDITERKEIEQSLRESEEKFSKAFDNNPAIMLLVDISKMVILDVNKAYCTKLKQRKEDVINIPNKMGFLAPKEKVSAGLEIIQTTNHLSDFEILITNSQDEKITGLLFAEPIYLQAKHCHILTLVDISERRKAEEEVRLQRDRLAELSRHLVIMQEAERRTIGCELHDQFGQMLTAMQINLDIAQHLPSDQAIKKIQRAQEITADLLNRVSHISLELRPPMLDELGLIPSLLWHVNAYQEQTGIEIDFKHHGVETRRFSTETEITAYRIVQEALTNIARHACATHVHLTVTMNLHEGNQQMEIQLDDNGKGFDVDAAFASYHGLTGLRDRIKLIGGSFDIQSVPQKGTHLAACLPISGEEAK